MGGCAVEVGYATSVKSNFSQYAASHHAERHNCQVVFASDDDFEYYQENLILFKKEFGCKIYAYGLMTNHVHLIVGHVVFYSRHEKGLPGICFCNDT